MSSYNRDIRYIKGVGEKKAQLFGKLGLSSLDALIAYYPRAYEDWSNPIRICDVIPDQTVCIRATVASEVTEHRTNSKIMLYKFFIYDRTGQLTVTLFNNKYLAASIKKGTEYLFYGKVTTGLLMREMASPEIRSTTDSYIRPIYSSTEGLTSRMIEKTMKIALTFLTEEDPLPGDMINRLGLCSEEHALRNIHFPENAEQLDISKRRLVFDELFMLRTGFLLLKNRNRGVTGTKIKNSYVDEFKTLLPFSLTGAQERVITECLQNMSDITPMNRLLQGDVGSGKTAVAAALMHTVKQNGYVSVMMAPTEVLAEQHFHTLTELFKQTNFKIALLVGSVPKAQKNKIKKELEQSEIDIIVATHAILTDDVVLKNVALIITDEQHRFGVAQRATLSNKANHPHTLVMSATPIPRTLGLMIYGDLDISILDELPTGRTPIKSYQVGTDIRERAYGYVKKHLDEGRQGYVVCPLIEEGENDLTPATEYAKELSESYFKNYTVGLLHGKMKPKEKEAVMKRFVDGEIQLLVSTTVIEVGVDVPNAVIMVIENAERFGLSQLHQLRGRVGRGKYPSTCIFISDAMNTEAKKRFQIICSTTDGFKIADEDLVLRGPGDFLGKRQHGLPQLRLADIINDVDLLHLAGNEAEALLKQDPELKSTEHQLLKSNIEAMFSGDDGVEFN